jgi:hypothetical protein
VKKLILKISVIAIFTCIINFAQNRDSLIQLTPDLGDTIDENEMAQIQILNMNSWTGFKRLVFYVRNDTCLVSKITYENKNGELRDSIIFSYIGVLNSLRMKLQEMEKAELKLIEDGTLIVVRTKDGFIHEGVPKFVSSNNLVIMNRKSFAESHPDYYKVVKWTFYKSDINSVFIKGHSKILAGLGIGCLVGIIGGFIAGYSEGDDPPGCLALSAGDKGLLSALLFGPAGAVLGLVFGLASSSSDEEIVITDDYDLNKLGKYLAR